MRTKGWWCLFVGFVFRVDVALRFDNRIASIGVNGTSSIDLYKGLLCYPHHSMRPELRKASKSEHEPAYRFMDVEGRQERVLDVPCLRGRNDSQMQSLNQLQKSGAKVLSLHLWSRNPFRCREPTNPHARWNSRMHSLSRGENGGSRYTESVESSNIFLRLLSADTPELPSSPRCEGQAKA